ncbi:MAG: SDR family NAD(P)-dependent oxidoreductase [Gemmatimonadales bacterium]
MASEFDFQGKVVLVTGVGRAGQIGHSVALAFGRAGAKIVSADRNATGVADRVREFAAEGIDVRPSAGDLTEPDIAALGAETALKHFGRLDVLVNVAGGLTTYGPIEQTGAEAFDREIAINLKTCYLMSRAAGDALAKTRGSIVNFASVAYYRPQANLAAYSAAKAGVAALTQALALEYRERGIRVNAVAPGMVRTPQNVAEVGEDARFVEIRQITDAVLFLSSDLATGVSGLILPVTNGEF